MRKKIDTVNQVVLSGPSQPPAAGDAVDAARDDDVLEAIHGVMHLARGQQQRAMREAEHGLSPMEGRVLAYFARHPGATLSDLVTHSGRDKGQLARMVGGLRRQGLLLATPDPLDRRISRLRLAGEAQARHRVLQAQRRALSERATAALGPAERRQLLDLLAKVREALLASP